MPPGRSLARRRSPRGARPARCLEAGDVRFNFGCYLMMEKRHGYLVAVMQWQTPSVL